MKIISWNVNSVRARISNILDYIKQADPDVLLFQEIKTIDEHFPYEDFKKKDTTHMCTDKKVIMV